MKYVFIIMISTGVAACIGGITNYLAIKMLFRPRYPRMLGRYKLPFTPGLIPKRKDEIASSLGKVVADYLVTSQGLANVLHKAEFRNKLEAQMRRLIVDWTSREETIDQVCRGFWSPEQIRMGQGKLVRWLEGAAEKGFTWLWEGQGWSSRTLTQLIPDWSEHTKEQLALRSAGYVLAEVKKEILSPGGEQMLKQLVLQTMNQSGGLLGALAGIFMDEDRMIDKIRGIIIERIDSATVKAGVSEFILKKLDQIEQISLEELLERVVQSEGKAWLFEQLPKILPWEVWIGQIRSMELQEWLADQQEWMLAKVPWAQGMLLQWIEANLERVISAIELPKLVEEQVEKFPVERLEEILLNVSGREFKAITWLGALLGGMIGLGQAIFLIWYT